MTNLALVEEPKDLTADWMTLALRAAGLDVTVASLRSEPVGTGQMAHNERIFLQYAGDAPGAPKTLVGKFASPDEESRASGSKGAYRTETHFYTELAAKLPCATPRCYFGTVADDDATFTLLLEDLAPKVQGDQILGASDDEIEAAVRNLAGLHAPYWCDPALDSFGWTAGGIGDEFVTYIQMGTPAFIDRYQDRLLPEDADLLRAFAEGVTNWMERRPAFRTLVHGDYRLDNLMFEKTSAGCSVSAVDWQTLSVACGGQDLAFLLGNSSPPAQRRAHEDRMLAAYREEMARHGVALSDAEVRDDYVYGTFQGPSITMLGSLGVGQTDRGDAMFMAMAERSCAQIRDTNALDRIA